MRPTKLHHGIALVLATVALLMSAPASAFQPESARVVDRLWATGQPWVVFSTPTLYNTLRVRVTGLTVSCVDPVAGRFSAPGGVAPEMCAGGMHNPDLYVHVFRNIVGELQGPFSSGGERGWRSVGSGRDRARASS